MTKGYTLGENGTPYQHSDKADRATRILPQLLNPIDDIEVKRLLREPAWCLQEKFDGKRVLLQKKRETVTAINRKGLIIGLPSAICADVQRINNEFVVDGECIGDDFYSFDLLELNGEDYRQKPYKRRLVSLSEVLNAPGWHTLSLSRPLPTQPISNGYSGSCRKKGAKASSSSASMLHTHQAGQPVVARRLSISSTRLCRPWSPK